MDVLITQKKMTDSEAFVKARGGGNLIGKAMYGGGNITMKQLYLQSFEVVFDAYFKPGLVERFFPGGVPRCGWPERSRAAPSLPHP